MTHPLRGLLAAPELLGNLLLGPYLTLHHSVLQLQMQLVKRSLTACIQRKSQSGSVGSEGLVSESHI